ncbi:MAG: hypothetical protein H6Q64_231 [Firmicutes bacterium]|nr:hypothetical protein [Bacillota bacterium]
MTISARSRTLLKILVSLGLLAWLAFSIDWNELSRVLLHIDYKWIAVAVLWIVLSVVISVYKWQVILRVQGLDPGWTELWKAYWAGLFFNNFLPSSIGGDAMRIYWITKKNSDTAGSLTSVVAERILATTGLALTGLLGGLLVATSFQPLFFIFLLLIAASLGLLAIITAGKLPGWIERKSGRAVSFLKRIAGHGTRFQGNIKAITGVILLSVLFQVAVVGVNHAIFQALHLSNLGWPVALYVIPATSVAAMIPVGINGYGIREGAYMTLLAGYGTAQGTAFAASLLFAFLVSICSLYGGLVWLMQRDKGGNQSAAIESIYDRKQ